MTPIIQTLIVWLELLPEQDKAGDVRQFLQAIEGCLLAITDFSVYSIGIILTRLKKIAYCPETIQP